MAIIMSHYSTIYRYLSRAFQCRFASVLRGLTYYFRLGYVGAWLAIVSRYIRQLENWILLVIRLFGSWSGDISSTSVTSAKTNLSGLPDQPPCSFFSDRRQDKVSSDPVAWRWIGRHNRALQWKRTGRAGRWWNDTPCRLCKHTDNWPKSYVSVNQNHPLNGWFAKAL